MNEPQRNPNGIAVYVTSHGFGHLNRTVAVINRLPETIPVVIRCHPNLFGSWGERLQRPARLEAHESDAGAVNPPGDSAATDGPATLRRAFEVHARALAGVDAEAEKLRAEGTAAVLCDAPPLPLVAARRAGVPGCLLANFTWADIYREHAEVAGPEAMVRVEEIADAYRTASVLFRAGPALPMTGVAETTVDVGLVVSTGRDRRDELRERFGLRPSDRIVYSYVGRYGQDGMGWDRLARLDDVHFVGFHPAPGGQVVPNLHVVPAEGWTGADLAASADAIVAKAGYGTVCEAMAAQTPFIYPPRTGFAEHQALDEALTAWGAGVPISADDFNALRVETALERAFALRPGPPPFPVDGAARVAAYLARLVAEPRA